MQRPGMVLKVVDLLRQGLLDVERDRRGLEDFLRWVDGWRPESKSEIRRLIGYLRTTYPQTTVWDVVTF